VTDERKQWRRGRRAGLGIVAERRSGLGATVPRGRRALQGAARAAHQIRDRTPTMPNKHKSDGHKFS